jgi:ABC-2 type transport system ATP-binding protein
MNELQPGVIQVSDLSKTYGSYRAVDEVSFSVAAGAVTGFVGPNGAGKSTVLRMLVGLTTPSAGTARILGHDFRRLPNPGRQVGVVLDASALHSGRTGRESLMVAAFTMRLAPWRVDEALEVVGLTPAEAQRRIGTYSLGMRQRLAIAQALLGEPRVLILDEPSNGLDLGGVHWLRTLVRGFADAGGTVLLSSHLLRELEAVADHFVVLGAGRVLAAGTTSQLLEGAPADGDSAERLERRFLELTSASARSAVA